MAATQQGNAAISYKEKLLQPSDQDELSHPSTQETLPKLPPTKDEGSPPMTINTPAPAPAGEDEATTAGSGSSGKPWSPKGNTQSAVDGRYKFAHSADGKQGVPKADYEAPASSEGSAGAATQPQNVDDYPSEQDVPPPAARQAKGESTATESPPASTQINAADVAGAKVGNVELSDTEQQAIADPSTADLLAAATQDTDAPATAPLPAANAVVVNADEPPAAAAGGSAAAAEGGAGESLDTSAHNVGLGDVLGMPIMVRRIITAPSDAAALNAEAEDAARNAPGKAHGMSVTPRSGDCARRSPRSSSDSSSSAAAAADGELAEGAGGDARMFTASDFAAAGLADLTAEADAAEAAGGAGDESAGNDEADDAAAEPAASSYGALQQAPAAAGDAAAVPAPGTPESHSQGDSSSAGGDSGSSSSGVVQQVVGTAKSAAGAAADLVTGDSQKSAAATSPAGQQGGIGGAVGAVMNATKSAVDSATAAASAAVSKEGDSTAAEADEEKESGSGGGGIGGAVGALMGGLKDVLIGHDVPVEAVTTAVGEGVDDSAQAAGGADSGQEMQRSAKEEGQPSSFAVL